MMPTTPIVVGAPTPPSATAPVPPTPPPISAHALQAAGAGPSAATTRSAANAARRSISLTRVLRQAACARRMEEIDAEREPVLVAGPPGVALFQLDGAPVQLLYRFHAALLGKRRQLANRLLGQSVVMHAALEERLA